MGDVTANALFPRVTNRILPPSLAVHLLGFVWGSKPLTHAAKSGDFQKGLRGQRWTEKLEAAYDDPGATMSLVSLLVLLSKDQ
jgi:hypothetical protein